MIGSEYSHETNVIMAWRRDSMGEAKARVCGKFRNCSAENKPALSPVIIRYLPVSAAGIFVCRSPVVVSAGKCVNQ